MPPSMALVFPLGCKPAMMLENECYQHNSTEKAERRFAGVATNRDRWKREIGSAARLSASRPASSFFPQGDSRSSTYQDTSFYAASLSPSGRRVASFHPVHRDFAFYSIDRLVICSNFSSSRDSNTSL